jgi:hypothetical protein
MRLDKKGAKQLEALQGAKRLHLIDVLASAAPLKGSKHMAAISRRAMLMNILPGAVVAIAGVGQTANRMRMSG